MKTLTTKTITKAAPLALLAVVMSGSAFAGNGNGKGPRVQGSKLSLDVNTTCELVPNQYATGPYDYEDPVLIVTTVVDSSDSGDNGIGDSEVLSKKAQAIATKGNKSEFIGEEKDLIPMAVNPDPVNGPAIVTYTQYFDICDEFDDGYDLTRGLLPSDKAVSAVATIIVDDGENMVSFASQCENIDPYPDTEEDEDGVDQSNFDIGTDALPPYEYPVVCSSW